MLCTKKYVILKEKMCLGDDRSDTRREYCENELATLYPEIKRLDNPHKYIVDISVKMQEIKKDLLFNSK